VGDVVLSINRDLTETHEEAVKVMDESKGPMTFMLQGPTHKVILDKEQIRNLELRFTDKGARKQRQGLTVATPPSHTCGIAAGDVVLSLAGDLANSEIEVNNRIKACQRFVEVVLEGPYDEKVWGQCKRIRVDKQTGPIACTCADTPPGKPGVVVVALDAGSALFGAGIDVGDVILSINNFPVTHHEQAVEEFDNKNFRIVNVVIAVEKADLSAILPKAARQAAEKKAEAPPPAAEASQDLAAAEADDEDDEEEDDGEIEQRSMTMDSRTKNAAAAAAEPAVEDEVCFRV
jgi:hypothetical protein